jgi:hypothetical protein
MIRNLLLLALLLPVLSLTPAAGGDSDQTTQRWLHVRVDDSGSDGERVRINLPLELVAEILPMIEADDFHGGHVRFGAHDLDGLDLSALVRAVRKASDGEYVTVEGRDETVRMTKEGDLMLITVDEEDEKVSIRMRLSVVDALFSGEQGEVNLVAAVKALEAEGDCEIVRIDGEDETVRIWIDQDDTAD